MVRVNKKKLKKQLKEKPNNELWDAYNKGYITLEDITNQLELETGLEYRDVTDG